ncbi:SDR family NAD(P)-dependent oxidoreductase [Sciscionella sediminilitoris]|uniref:SDR family NAD(P)-dependent oxidoreductase n=1 Tax=Sciscionella sediminilitoris TaxID=1445613 RepID=UPI0004DED5F0|nr:SDR family NAD(P)-dependent oxidoreductase [Sciscionella sp. SE31]
MNSALVIGASRALGLSLATEFSRRGWAVTGTVRGNRRTGLHELAETSQGRVSVETLEMTEPEQVSALRARLTVRTFDLLFVNAAITRGDIPIGEVPAEMFTEVMLTNALGPMRVVEALRSLVSPQGTIGIMSSRQGSIGCNTGGGQDVYRASKSALNQLMRCYAARYADSAHSLLLACPGHVRTELGGPDAPLSIEQSVPGVVDMIERHRGEPGLRFLNYQDEPVPW